MSPETQVRTSMTLKEKAIAVMHGPDLLPPTEDLHAMPLAELKLETDARAALFIGAFKSFALTDETQDVLVDWLQQPEDVNFDNFSHIELAEYLKQTTPYFFQSILPIYTEQYEKTDAGQKFMASFDGYRAAYFARSPAADKKERQYESIETLVLTGIVTGLMHIRGIMARQDAAAIMGGLSVEKTEELVRRSPHLVMLISKLSLEDEERYVEAANQGGLDGNPVKLVSKDTYSFTPQLFKAMHQLPKNPSVAHRPHLQCPASLSFPGEPSFNSELWDWYNGALAKAGFWDKQK